MRKLVRLNAKWVVALAFVAGVWANEVGAQPAAPKNDQGGKLRLDFYGDPLPEGAIARLGTIRLRHGVHISSLQFTPDGKLLVSQGGEGAAIWKADTGALVHFFPSEWEGTQMPHCSTTVSRDGAFIAYAGKTGVHIHEIASGKRVKTIETGPIYFPRFSPDGKRLAVRSQKTKYPVEVWDIARGEMIWSGGGDDASMLACLDFTPDGKTLITAGNLTNPDPKGSKIRFWDAATGKLLKQIGTGTLDPRRLVISPDGKLLAVICEDDYREEDRVRIFDIAAAKEVRQLVPAVKDKGVNGRPGVTAVAFAPDGKALYTVGIDDTLFIWDPHNTGKELRRVGVKVPRAHSLAVSPDGKTLALGGAWYDIIRLIDVQTGMDKLPVLGHTELVRSTVVSRDGYKVVTCGSDHVIAWDAKTGKELYRLDAVSSVYLRGQVTDGRSFVTSEIDKGREFQTLRTWDLATGKELRQFKWKMDKQSPASLVAISPDEKTLVMGWVLNSPTLFLVSVDTGKILRTLGNSERGANVKGAAFTLDGRKLILWDAQRQIQVCDMNEPGAVKQFSTVTLKGNRQLDPMGNFNVVVSPDGRLIAVHHGDNYIVIQDLASGRLVRQTTGLPARVAVMAFSPDSKSVAWASSFSPHTGIIEIATGRERHSFVGHKWSVDSLTFAANGKILVSTSRDSTGLVWDLTGQHAAKTPLAKKLTAAELDGCWADLAGEDAARAYQTTRRLAAAPADAVPYLKKKLPAVTPVDEKRLAGLVADLDKDVFKVRQAATKELEDIGEATAGYLQKVLAGKPSLELKRRIEGLLEKMAKEWENPGPSNLRILRALETLELAGTPEAREVLEGLARGAVGARMTEESLAGLKRLGK